MHITHVPSYIASVRNVTHDLHVLLSKTLSNMYTVDKRHL